MSRERMVAGDRRSLPIRPTGDVTVVYATSAVMLPVVGDEGDRLWPAELQSGFGLDSGAVADVAGIYIDVHGPGHTIQPRNRSCVR
jgi:hypothetical protein